MEKQARNTPSVFFEAISTPLASIFGSGFLVIIPVLAGATGPWIVLAMLTVVTFAFCVGEVIRHNIIHVEPIIETQSQKNTVFIEKVSDISLVLAYVISVTLYLQILSSFLLTGFEMDAPTNQSILTTIIIAGIVLIALTKGLKGLTFLEKWALAITFLLILIVLMGFGIYDLQQEHFQTVALPQLTLWESLTLVAGTLIVVQGFETPRYLGEKYSSDLRVKTSRWSQIISSIVYMAFVALALPVLHELNGQYADSSLIRLVGFTVIPYLGFGVILAAVLSQFSAAVADTITAEGNVFELSNKKVKPQCTYIAIGILSISLAWFADIFELVVLASKAFAIYYFLQCLVAITATHIWHKKVIFSLIAAGLLFIVFFSVPVG